MEMKKVLSILICLIVMFGVCVVGTGCDPNKETEAEYKARIRKEYDSIPVEATGYELITCDSGEKCNYEYISFGHRGGVNHFEKEINDHKYTITIYAESKTTEDDFGVKVSIDGGDEKWVSFNYNENYKYFGWVWEIVFYDGELFFIRANVTHRWVSKITDYAPATLFIYNYDSNTLKYLGYDKTWFDYPIYGSKSNFQSIIRKIRQQEEIE